VSCLVLNACKGAAPNHPTRFLSPRLATTTALRSVVASARRPATLHPAVQDHFGLVTELTDDDDVLQTRRFLTDTCADFKRRLPEEPQAPRRPSLLLARIAKASVMNPILTPSSSASSSQIRMIAPSSMFSATI
jgi:hypothetical protein